VWIANAHVLGGRTPQWVSGGEPLTGSRDCPAEYRKGTCVELEVKRREKKVISALIPDGGFTLGAAEVLVNDRLVVGLGDSYASGEGNPDIPARFTQGDPNDLDVLYGLRLTPRKDRGSKVVWLDQRCHRSMYSYQFKTALQLALANPREAITYVSFSCSGATTDDIISKKQGPREGLRKVEVQLKALRKALTAGGGAPREIDYLLLSTGGNDVKFSKFLAYVVARGIVRNFAARGVNKQTLKENEAKIRELLLGDGNGGN
jgi:hypothetical protein